MDTEEIGSGLNKVLSQHLPGKLGEKPQKKTLTIISVPIEIRIGGLHNRSPNLHRLRQFSWIYYVRKTEWRSSTNLRENCSYPLCEMYSSLLNFPEVTCSKNFI
jgi:hypothetical protein